MKEFAIIVAVAEKNAIGRGNDLLCYISEDLKRFKRLTSGHTVIMGRKTFESLPFKPLPKRKNIVITRDRNFSYQGVEVAHSIEEAKEKADDGLNFIIGGGEIYNTFMPEASKLYITEVHKEFEADVFFPEINNNIWKEEIREHNQAQGETPAYSYVDYVRK